jgi:hypothetical protein
MNAVLARSMFFAAVLAATASNSALAGGDDWVAYAASDPARKAESTLGHSYILNVLVPVSGDAASADHFYDRDSVARSSPGAGGIVRVWERYVLRAETLSYEQTIASVEGAEEKRLGRKVSPIEHARLFPLAVQKATKEVRTLYEINCDSREFIILEVDHYDKDDQRMTRETNFAMGQWYRVEPGTVMDALFRQVCGQAPARRAQDPPTLARPKQKGGSPEAARRIPPDIGEPVIRRRNRRGRPSGERYP